MAGKRRNSILSFRKSSSGSIPKVDASETAKEKERYHIKTKADPTKAINEAEPATRNATETITISSIRHIEHRDAEGNIIADPDVSNPTRPRMERPLDTIRSFEAAIDGSYNRRASSRPESTNPLSPQNSRRSGFFPGYQNQQRSQEKVGGYGGYYGGRNSIVRPDSYADGYGTPPSQYGNGNGNGSGTPPNQYGNGNGNNGNGNGNRRRFGPRNHSDPALYGHNGNQDIYPSHVQQLSYDTVGSASNGSHVTDQWGNSTDPSSENSSIDRVQAPTKVVKPDLGEAYGFNGFGGAPQFQGPILEEHGQGAPGYGQPGYGQQQAVARNGYPHQGNGFAPPPPPPHKDDRPRVPIKLGAPPVGSRPPPSVDTEKRKSWLKRHFSKG